MKKSVYRKINLKLIYLKNYLRIICRYKFLPTMLLFYFIILFFNFIILQYIQNY